MAESSSRRRRRHRSSSRKSRRSKDRRSKPAATPSRRRPVAEQATSPPSYSVEENEKGEWINSRLNVKWPQQVDGYNVGKHRYLTLADSDNDSVSDRKQNERRSRKKRSKRERKEKKKRDQSKKSSRSVSSVAARSPLSNPEKDPQYITLSTSEQEDSSKRAPRLERKRGTVQTSPQRSKRSHSSFATDEDGKKIDSVVFDTRSEMMRYKKSDDILVPTKSRTTRPKKTSVADLQRENEEYNRYYVGVKSRRNVESKLKQPGDFSLYYEKPAEGEFPSAVGLKVAYLSSESQPYHFPIQCFEGVDGHKHYVVMQNKSDGKMFTSILSLVKHYSLYSHVDTSTGRLETFAVPH